MWTFNLSKLFNRLAGEISKDKLSKTHFSKNKFQNQNSAKPPPLCPFCRGEIKGFESIVISPFDSALTINRKESSPNGSNEFDDVRKIHY